MPGTRLASQETEAMRSLWNDSDAAAMPDLDGLLYASYRQVWKNESH